MFKLNQVVTCTMNTHETNIKECIAALESIVEQKHPLFDLDAVKQVLAVKQSDIATYDFEDQHAASFFVESTLEDMDSLAPEGYEFIGLSVRYEYGYWEK